MPDFDNAELTQLWPGYQTWDNGSVQNEIDGAIADVSGFHVVWALCRPESADFTGGNRLAYFYSSDNKHYTPGGFLFGDSTLYDNVAEWSGSVILREDGKLQTFYTVADSVQPEGVYQMRQRLATAIQTYEVVDGKLVIHAPEYHALLHGASEPDGLLYETPEQASHRERVLPTAHSAKEGSDQTENNCDRDPYHFHDRKTGDSYLFFEGNTGAEFNPAGVIREEYLGRKIGSGFAPTVDMLKANGCIGVIKLTNKDKTYGRRLKPWATFNLVTDEVERINLIEHDGGYYLFTTCHGNKMTTNGENPDMVNRDIMLGFRAEYLGGPLTPLNGNGVVIQQKSGGVAYAGQEENQQHVYSWKIEIDQRGKETGELLCLSYADWCKASDGTVRKLMNAGPAVRIKIKGLKTEIVDMEYNIISA